MTYYYALSLNIFCRYPILLPAIIHEEELSEIIFEKVVSNSGASSKTTFVRSFASVSDNSIEMTMYIVSADELREDKILAQDVVVPVSAKEIHELDGSDEHDKLIESLYPACAIDISSLSKEEYQEYLKRLDDIAIEVETHVVVSQIFKRERL